MACLENSISEVLSQLIQLRNQRVVRVLEEVHRQLVRRRRKGVERGLDVERRESLAESSAEELPISHFGVELGLRQRGFHQVSIQSLN